MRQKTLMLHMTRCPDKPKSSSRIFKSCTFNKLHVVPEHELKYHEENCLDRIQLDKHLYETSISQHPQVIIEKEPIILKDESWDEPDETINILEKVNQKITVMKPMYGLSKSKRKQFRAQLHTQCQNIDPSYLVDSTIQDRQDALTSTSNIANDECKKKNDQLDE